MKRYCMLTGIDLSGDGATNGFKTMCLNCTTCHYDSEKDQFTCSNEKVMEVGKQKILAAIPEGFEVETLTLKPMVLKDPTKKCKNHQFNLDGAVEYLKSYFIPSADSEKENASE